jgi:hypothetical protein
MQVRRSPSPAQQKMQPRSMAKQQQPLSMAQQTAAKAESWAQPSVQEQTRPASLKKQSPTRAQDLDANHKAPGRRWS